VAESDRLGGYLGQHHLMRMADRFSRRVRGWAKANGVPVIDCRAGERKHDLAEEYLQTTKVARGVFLILVRKAQSPVWEVSVRARQEVCVNGLVFSLRRRLPGRWESGNPVFGFPLFHRPLRNSCFGVRRSI